MGEKSGNTITLGGGIQANTSGLNSMFSLLGKTSASVTSAGSTSFGAGSARAMMKNIDSALNQLNSWRSDVGSTQNQLESALRNMMTQKTNIKAAESVIRDVDYAQESANFNKQNIIAQAGTYAMSQSNAIQQNVLRLLQ
jgi:flagellin